MGRLSLTLPAITSRPGIDWTRARFRKLPPTAGAGFAMRYLEQPSTHPAVWHDPDTGLTPTAPSEDAGSQLESAREADQAYRAQRHAELSRRMHCQIALLKFLQDDRLIVPYFVSWGIGVSVGSLLVASGIIRGDRDRDYFPWELQLGVVTIVAALTLPLAVSAATDRLRTYLLKTFEGEGLTFDEHRRNRRR